MGRMPATKNEDAAVRRVRTALLRGETWRVAVEGTGFSRTTARRRLLRRYPEVFSDPRRRTAPAPVSPAERRTIARRLALAESYRQIARRIGRSPDTVWRVARAADHDDAGEFAPRRLRRAVICPGCRCRTLLWPCVRCAAAAVTPPAESP